MRPTLKCLTATRRLSDVGDGLSNTIGLAEHYARINRSSDDPSVIVWYKYTQGDNPSIDPHAVPKNMMVGFQHRPTFADHAWGDVVPVVGPGGTTASSPPLTFQAAPALAIANPWIAQSPYHKCMVVSFLDGSTRTISDTMRERVYWSLVSPKGNEPAFPE